VRVDIGGAEGKRALADLEVALRELDALRRDHLLVDVGAAEFFVHET